MDILQAGVSRKSKIISNPEDPKHISCKEVQFMQKEVIPYDHLDEDSTSEEFILLASQDQMQLVPRPTHLITNLAHRLKPHHTRNLYLRARLDTCTEWNLMPASLYQLVFNDTEMQKLAPSNLQVGTYTTDTVKIVGSCTF